MDQCVGPVYVYVLFSVFYDHGWRLEHVCILSGFADAPQR